MSREKQIEEMAKILCGRENGCDKCMFNKVHCYERNDAEALYNAGYRKIYDDNGWIAVEDAIPDPAEYDWVLGNVMFNEDGTYGVPCIVEHRCDGKWYSVDGWDITSLYETVTHWMPLPNYPRAKKKE